MRNFILILLFFLLTGNYEKDLFGNQSKRIFTDNGLRGANHVNRVLLQTYGEENGGVMHDISIPIHSKRRHWGGFRIEYRPIPLKKYYTYILLNLYI